MTADTLTLLVVAGGALLVFVLRASAPLAIMAALAGWFVGIMAGDLVENFGGQLLVWLVLGLGPVSIIIWRSRGSARGRRLPRAVNSLLLSVAVVVMLLDITTATGRNSVFYEAYFARLLGDYTDLIILVALLVATVEIAVGGLHLSGKSTSRGKH